MVSRKINNSIQQQVRQRALELCEYCHASEKWQYVLFTVDHIIPLSKNGQDTIDNLALACFHCNRRKSNHITGIDPDSGNQVALFNPRKSLWNEHFIWSIDGLIIIGVTPTGKATIATLDLNRERIINIRAADKAINRHPPSEDAIEK
ncbi:HNH endonuclease [Anabaena azotica]|uniref:HNH endonuclease n=1 Tax=Anabaena azotica TaxID=197653 RepID=UPI0039A59FD4